MQKLSDYIVTIPNLISPEDCDSIIAAHKDSPEWVPGTIGDNTINLKARRCYQLTIGEGPTDDQLYDITKKALEHYKSIVPRAHMSSDCGYKLLRYDVGGRYVEHTDAYVTEPRYLTLSVTLNDEYDGGHWSFFGGQYQLFPEKGTAVMFPSNFMFPHAIMPVTKGTRYAFVTWYA